MTFLLALALTLVPTLPLTILNRQGDQRLKHQAMLAALLLATLAATVYALPFAPMGVWFLWRWRSRAELGSLAGWALGATAWVLAAHVPRETLEWVAGGWAAWACLQVGLLVGQRARIVTWERTPAGTFGQRTMAAAYLALVWPFAPLWAWPWLLVGLWLTGPSWGALLALGAGLPLLAGSGVAVPVWWGVAGAGAFLVAYSRRERVETPAWGLQHLLDWYTPRGTSVKTLAGRLEGARCVLTQWRRIGVWGHGPGSIWTALRRHRWATKREIPYGELHCDPLQLWWEHGACGLAAMGLLVWTVGRGLTWGDSWSAAAVIALLLSCTSYPLRIASIGIPSVVILARVAGGL